MAVNSRLESDDLPTISQLEAWLPYPVSRSLKNARDIPKSRPFEQLDALTKVAEVTIKLLAAISAKAFLLDGGDSSDFQNALRQLGRMSLGNWVALLRSSVPPAAGEPTAGPMAKIAPAYHQTWGTDQAIRDAVTTICDRTQGEVKRPGGKLTTASLLDVLVGFRNFVAHGAKLSDEEWAELVPPVDRMLRSVLSSLTVFREYSLFLVDEVKVEKNVSGDRYVHYGLLATGREPEKLQLSGADALHDKRLYLVRFGEDNNLEYAIDLVPFWMLQSCPECHRSETFVINSIKGKRIVYISYQCGHRLEFQDISGEISDINAFLEGKITLEHLFSGKVIGHASERLLAGPTTAERRRAGALGAEARANLASGLYAESIPILDQALALNPDSDELHYLRGMALLLTSGDIRASVADLKEAARLNPDAHEALYFLAVVFEALGAAAVSRSYVERAIAKDPANARYRALEQKIPDVDVGVPEQDLDYELSAKLQEGLNSLAEEILASQRATRVKLRNWTAALPPFSWIVGSPLRGSLIVAWSLFAIVIALQGDTLSRATFFQQLSIAWNNWLILFISFAATDVTAALFEKLRPVVTVPEESFRRFFARQCSLLFGRTCVVSEDGKGKGAAETLRIDWRHALVAVVFFLILLALQYSCAQDPFRLDVPTLARYFSYVFEAYAMVWVAPATIFSLWFVPGFSNIPQRFFPEMPDSVSLRPLGQLYVTYGLFLAALIPGFLFQHYVFRTVEGAPVAHWGYFVFVALIAFCLFFLSQAIVKHTLFNLRDRTLTRFSYQLEIAFEDFLRNPGEKTFSRLEEYQQYMKNLMRISTKSLSTRDLVTLALTVAAVAVVLAIYFWLVANGVWLV